MSTGRELAQLLGTNIAHARKRTGLPQEEIASEPASIQRRSVSWSAESESPRPTR